MTGHWNIIIILQCTVLLKSNTLQLTDVLWCPGERSADQGPGLLPGSATDCPGNRSRSTPGYQPQSARLEQRDDNQPALRCRRRRAAVFRLRSDPPRLSAAQRR